MTKKSKNLDNMTEQDLQKTVIDLQDEIRGMKFKIEGAKSKDVKKIRETKREIARALTKLNGLKQN